MTETQERLLLFCGPPVLASVGYVIFAYINGWAGDPALVAQSALAMFFIAGIGWSFVLLMLWAFWAIGKGGAEIIHFLVNRD